MSNFSTYSMAGIGIAAAIGFVFALTYLTDNTTSLDTDSSDSLGLARQQPESVPSLPSSFFIEQNTSELPADQEKEGESATPMLKEEDAEGGSAVSQQETLDLTQENLTDLRPELTSLVAVNGSNGEMIGELVPGMQFTSGKPVFIQANFLNQNDGEVSDHIIILSIARNGTGDAVEQTSNVTQSYEQSATFRGDIGANGNVKVELFWNPDREGQHSLLLFSLTSSDVSSADVVGPIVAIPIRVVVNTVS